MGGNAPGGEVVDATPAMVPRAGMAGLSVLVCLLVFLPGFFSLPVTDSESRFAQVSREMYEAVSLPPAQRDPARHGNGLLVPNEASHPPLAHWLQVASAAAMSSGNPHRDAPWMYRLPSLIGAIIAVVLTRRIGTAIFDRGVGRFAAVLLAVTPLMGWGARQAMPDVVALAFVAGAMAGLYQAFEVGRLTLGRAIWLWVSVAGATLCGGPLSFLIILSCCVMLCVVSRRWSWLRDARLIGAAGAAGVIGAWFHAAGDAIGHARLIEAIVRGAVWSERGNWLPPGFHTSLTLVLFWPAMLLIATGVIVAWKLGVRRDHARVDTPIAARARLDQVHPGYLFLIAWLVPALILLEAVPGKTVLSGLVTYPPLAILAARALLAASAGALPGVTSALQRGWSVLWLVIGAGWVLGVLGALVLGLVVWPSTGLGTAGAGAAIALGGFLMLRALAAGWKAVQKGRFVQGALAGTGAMVVASLLLPTMALPRYLGLADGVAAQLLRMDASGSRGVAAVGVEVRGLDFHTRGRVVRLEPRDLPGWINANPTGIVIREAGTASIQGWPKLRPVARVWGLDTSRWRGTELIIEEPAR